MSLLADVRPCWTPRGTVLAGLLFATACRAAPPELPEDEIAYRQRPISYFSDATEDPVAQLDRKLAAGEVRLAWTPEQGYLRSVLKALDVPVESQALVFSKTSANVSNVGPKSPRAIYFNERVYVGWVRGAKALEISAVDPQKGAVFYTLGQAERDDVRLARQESCLLCHASTSSLKVPGHLLKSYAVDDVGRMLAGYPRVTHEMPLAERWGGWYVTGRHGSLAHIGNLAGEAAAERHTEDPSFGGNVTDLRRYFDTGPYLTPHSDIVALLVLDHQVHGQNLLTRLNYESRLGRPTELMEPFTARYLLFADEASWSDPIEGTAGFREVFEARGIKDEHGRSLWQLDLTQRLQKHRLSYLVYSPQFLSLPDDVRRRVWGLMDDTLQGRKKEGWPHLAEAESAPLCELLTATHPDWQSRLK